MVFGVRSGTGDVRHELRRAVVPLHMVELVQAKFYELTAQGRGQLKDETEHWVRLSAAVAGIVGA